MTECCPLGGCTLRAVTGDEGTSSYVVVRPTVDAAADRRAMNQTLIDSYRFLEIDHRLWYQRGWDAALAYARAAQEPSHAD